MKKNYKQVVKDALKAFPMNQEEYEKLGIYQRPIYMKNLIRARKEYIEKEVQKRILDSKTI